MKTYLFSGYARLPQDVSHQNVHRRVGLVVEVDERGVVTACSSTLLMDLARDFIARLMVGRSLVTERAEIEADVREFYLGHSQAALLFALHQVFEAVDLSAPFGARARPAEGAGASPRRADDSGPTARDADGPTGRDADGPKGRDADGPGPKGREA